MSRILTREKVTRAFYFALKEIAAEQQRCERVLGLLLPPTLVNKMRSVVVEAAVGNGNASRRSSGGSVDSGSPAAASMGSGDLIDVVTVGAAERFAEAFESASVLFAEGAGGFTR